MAHVRQEIAFRLIGRFGGPPRCPGILLGEFSLRDVDHDADELFGVSRGANDAYRGGQPHLAAIVCDHAMLKLLNAAGSDGFGAA